MKNNRQSMILDIIAKEHIETQEHLPIRGFQQPGASEHCGQAAHHLP